jgi:hypothetical protein
MRQGVGPAAGHVAQQAAQHAESFSLHGALCNLRYLRYVFQYRQPDLLGALRVIHSQDGAATL